MATTEEVMAVMHDPDRGPVDYPAWDDERKILINIIRRQTEGGSGGNYTEGGGDKSTKTVVIGVGVTLLAAFILGGLALSNRVAAMEAKMSEWQSAINQRLGAQDLRLDRLENRRP